MSEKLDTRARLLVKSVSSDAGISVRARGFADAALIERQQRTAATSAELPRIVAEMLQLARMTASLLAAANQHHSRIAEGADVF